MDRMCLLLAALLMAHECGALINDGLHLYETLVYGLLPSIWHV